MEKTYEGAIELEATPGSWKPTQPKRAGGQKDRLSPLDEIIARINEEFFGDFTEADRVMVDTLYTKMRQDAKVKKRLQRCRKPQSSQKHETPPQKCSAAGFVI